MSSEIRRAQPGDLPALTELYNHYVRETSITFDIEPWTVEGRERWLWQYAETGRHQLFVACREGRPVGYAGSTRFRTKAAYETTVETTVYLAPDETGAGLGRRLYETLFDALGREPIRRLVAGITLPNEASLALHRRFGFEDVGVFHEVGFKFERYWDVLWLERVL